jgi:iron(III) transport system substrate-binding protein
MTRRQPRRPASPNAAGIPQEFRDPEGHWTGFAARARVVVVNTDEAASHETIRDYSDIFEPPMAEHAGLAMPLFGTTATHFALIYTEQGEEFATAWLRHLRERGVQILDSNSQVCDAVARGALLCGWTDSDDFAVARAEGRPIAQILPEAGVILIPNTVAMIAGAPHPNEARALIDFLLSPDVEKRLAEAPGRQIPLHAGVEAPDDVIQLSQIRLLPVDWPRVAANFDPATALVNQILVEGH